MEEKGELYRGELVDCWDAYSFFKIITTRWIGKPIYDMTIFLHIRVVKSMNNGESGGQEQRIYFVSQTHEIWGKLLGEVGKSLEECASMTFTVFWHVVKVILCPR